MHDADNSWIIGAVISTIAVIGGLLYFAIWVATGGHVPTSDERAAEVRGAAAVYGLRNVRDIYACILCCDHNDTIRLTFMAETADGKTVQCQACAGLLFKGWTIRVADIL